MDTKILVRAIAVLIVAIAMVLAVAWFGTIEGGSPVARQVQAERADDPLTAELRRCRSIGFDAAGSSSCEAVWAENRQRFFSTDDPSGQEPRLKVQDRIGPTRLRRSSSPVSDEEAR